MNHRISLNSKEQKVKSLNILMIRGRCFHYSHSLDEISSEQYSLFFPFYFHTVGETNFKNEHTCSILITFTYPLNTNFYLIDHHLIDDNLFKFVTCLVSIKHVTTTPGLHKHTKCIDSKLSFSTVYYNTAS